MSATDTLIKKNKTSVLKSQEDSLSFPFFSGGHGATVGGVSNHLEKGGQEGLSNSTAPKERVADGAVGRSVPLLGYEVITARYAYAKAKPKWSRQQKRAFHRVMSGVEFHHHKSRLRFMTLTSPPGSSSLTLQADFRAFKERIKRLTPLRLVKAGYIKAQQLHFYYPGKALSSKLAFNYIAIKTSEGNGVLHILYAGDFIPQSWLSGNWLALHGAWNVDIRDTYGSKRGIAGYLTQYCAGQHKFLRYSWSWGWVWQGFVKSWLYLKHCWRCANNGWDEWAHYKVSIPFVGNHGGAGLLGQWRWHLHAGVPP
ncbi:unnamed protein product [marine sediment metagenome]|uniref:Uncharacterized protein n=1 Tax=marine sediment metagenome TaxID=412755 RepID=X1PWI9_9ZZZZ